MMSRIQKHNAIERKSECCSVWGPCAVSIVYFDLSGCCCRAKWNYRTEKLASQRERKGEVKESKEAAKEKRRQAKRETSRIDPIIAKQGTKSEAEVRSSLSVARTTPSQDATTRNDAEDDDPTVKGAEIDAAKAVDGKKDGRNVKKAKRAKSRADRSQKRSAKKGTR